MLSSFGCPLLKCDSRLMYLELICLLHAEQTKILFLKFDAI